MHAHTQHLTRTTHPNALKKEKRCGGGGGEGGESVGEGERKRYHIPCAHDGSDVCSRTKKGGRMGQREQAMET